ncbi:Glucosidase 2 subunit beta, partial [Lachnellula cervina]
SSFRPAITYQTTSIMGRVEALVLLSTLTTSVLAAGSPRPIGVGPEFAKFYKSSDSFTCISNPSITLSPSQINDDYCDCPDGSDEPGTSACTYISTLSPPQPLTGSAQNSSVALPGFYCKNKGHLPSYIPHMYVNDGVCDYELCCDGSDEWEGVGGTKCEDKCKEIGKEWRKLDEIRQKSARAALKKKDELVKEAGELRAGVEKSIANLVVEIKLQEVKAAELQKVYEEVERRERGKVVKSPGKGSKVTILAGLAKTRVEELRNALTGVVSKRDALKEKVAKLEAILSTFKEEYNPNFNDEGVKRAVQSWENYAANKGTDADESAEDRDIESISKPDSESEGINWVEWETADEESDVEALYKIEEYLPASLRTWVHQKITDLRIILIENGILADNANSGSESKAVADARNSYNTVNDDLGIKKSSLGDLQGDLTKDYGADDIFRALKNTCVSKDSGEYEYELCWLDKTTQKSKKGGGNTGMGNFVRFDKLYVDEEVGADGKGLGQGERFVLMYENGQGCWNGPNRQTTVVLACAEKDEIWKVQEQEKCMYRMDVGSPTVCEKEVKVEKANKDEL